MIRGASDRTGKAKAALAYALGFFSAVPVLLTAGGDRYVKFHAWQSIAWSLVVAGAVTQVLQWLAPSLLLPWLFVILAYLLFGAIMVASGRDFRMPVVGRIVDAL